MQSDKKLNAVAILKQGFVLTKVNYRFFLPLFVVTFVAMYLAISLNRDAFLALIEPENEMKLQILMMVLGILFTPIEVAFMMIGLRAARHQPLHYGDIKSIAAYIPKIIILATLISFIVQLGMYVIIPGLLFAIIFSMAQMLMCDRHISLIAALQLSARTLIKHLMPCLAIYIVLGMLLVLSIFTFGLAYIFTAPLYYNVKGELYRQIFDDETSAKDSDETHANGFEA
ncbi:MAG: hypothetical protein HRU25_12365 [Psychrobium sp.]|nr:hypothetical protein [Psychrobium sp.]